MKTIRLAQAALLSGAIVLALSCGDSAPLGVTAPTADLGVDILHIGLLPCSPIPADSVTQMIGPEGGVLYVGPHRLSIPAGALEEPVTITAVAPSDTVNRVVFQPEGLVFEQPARLSMSYANCRGLSGLVPKRIAFTTDLLVIIEFLQSIDHPFARRVSAQLDHFSTYAVAW